MHLTFPPGGVRFSCMLQCSIYRSMREGSMSPAAKANREPTMEEMIDKADFRNETAALFLRGVERIAEVEKQYIDLALEHNKEMGELLKKAAARLPGGPRIPMMDLAYSAFNRYAD